MLKRRNNQDLPLSATSAPDGSGRSVQMDAPIVRAAKNASNYTRGSYLWVFGSIITIWLSWRYLRYHYASIYLQCSDRTCELQITPPESTRGISLKIDREQIASVNQIKVDVDGNLKSDHGHGLHHNVHSVEQAKKNRQDERFPDIHGLYNSFAINLREEGKDDATVMRMEEKMSAEKVEMLEKYGSAAMTEPELIQKFKVHDDSNKEAIKNAKEKARITKKLPSLAELKDFCIMDEKGVCSLIMRKYNVGETRRKATASVSRINSFIQGHRVKLVIRESRNVRWQGVVSIILGVFSLLMSLLLGQFSEPDKFTYGGQANVKSGNVQRQGVNRPRQKTRSSISEISYGGHVNTKNY